jgi:hypothetical protein
MTSRLRRYTAGQTLKGIPADLLNAMVDVVQRVEASGQLGQRPGELNRSSGIIRVRNDSGGSVARFGVLGIDDPVVTPTTNLSTFQNKPALSCSTPADADHRGRFVVLTEPLADGRIGRAWASGVCPVQIEVVTATESSTRAEITDTDATKLTANPNGSAEILWKETGTGTKWGLIRMGVAPASPLFPVNMTQTGGSSGDETEDASWTYTVTDTITGTQLDTAVDPAASPHTHARPSLGEMVAATKGIAYYLDDGTLVVHSCNEVPAVEDCTA